MSPTLREALSRSGFAEAATIEGAPDLDRRLTSSGFGVDGTRFVAAYYFEDELDNQFVRPSNTWPRVSGGPLVPAALDRLFDAALRR
jgi:hypothetical protein